jgi:hypothetical protein
VKRGQILKRAARFLAVRFLLGGLSLGVFQGAASVNCAEGSDSAEIVSGDSPIRISREFFRSHLLGKISIESSNSGVNILKNSPVLWREYPSTDPEPQAGALADFRDHQGCAYLSGAEGLAVCFTMMGDVSSLGINSREMKILGVQEYFTSAYQIAGSTGLNCRPEIQNVRFEKALSSEGMVALTFLSSAVIQSECKIPDDVLKVKIQFSVT